jgi:transcriptional regulator with XRE-family HTH domain
MPAMGARQRAVDTGTERALSIVADLGSELRRARMEHGLSQGVVGRAAGLSASQVSRVERAQAKCLSVRQAARLLAVVGLDLSARAYPRGTPVRDVAHRALLGRLKSRVSPGARWRFEVPVGEAGDGRAWDAVIDLGRARVAVEAETRPRDIQALQRRLALKIRDDPTVTAVVLLLADTRHNRQLLREHGDALRASLPLSGRDVLSAIGAGQPLGASGIVLL